MALDVARIEAGLILIEVDYISSKKALIESQKYSPAEIGLGKLVDLKKETFVGARALGARREERSLRALVGIGDQLERSGSALRQDGDGPASSQHGFAHRGAGVSRRKANWQGDLNNLVPNAEKNDRPGMRRTANTPPSVAHSTWK